MSSLRRVNKHHSRYHSICMFPCPSRSNKRYAFTQQSRRKLLAPAGVCLLSSEGISVRLHPPAFTIRRLSVGYKSLAVFVTAFYSIVAILYPSVRLVNPVLSTFFAAGLYFPCFPAGIVFSLFSVRPGLTNSGRHVIFSSITNAMTMLRSPHRFQRAGGWCEPAAGRNCGLPSEQKGRRFSRPFRYAPLQRLERL